MSDPVESTSTSVPDKDADATSVSTTTTTASPEKGTVSTEQANAEMAAQMHESTESIKSSVKGKLKGAVHAMIATSRMTKLMTGKKASDAGDGAIDSSDPKTETSDESSKDEAPEAKDKPNDEQNEGHPPSAAASGKHPDFATAGKIGGQSDLVAAASNHADDLEAAKKTASGDIAAVDSAQHVSSVKDAANVSTPSEAPATSTGSSHSSEVDDEETWKDKGDHTSNVSDDRETQEPVVDAPEEVTDDASDDELVEVPPKSVPEVFAIGLKVGDPCEKFEMILPLGVSSGTVIENIGGEGHSFEVPEGYETGDKIIILLPKSQKTGTLPAPNRNCPVALRVVVDEHEEYYLEGTVEEEEVEAFDGAGVGGSTRFHFTSDVDGKVHRNVSSSLLFDLRTEISTSAEGRTIRKDDKVMAYKDAQQKVMLPAEVVGILEDPTDGQIHVILAFMDGDRCKVQPVWIFNFKRYNTAMLIDGGEEDAKISTEDILAELSFENDAGMTSRAYRSVTMAIMASVRCFVKNKTGINDIPEKHVSMVKAIHNRDMRSVRKLKPDGTYEYYPFFGVHIPFYWFPGISWVCSKKNREQKSIIDKYGFGVVSYFKIMKSLIVIFSIMAFLTTPNAVLFFSSNSSWGRELYYTNTVNPIANIALTTIAAMGEPKLTCREGLEGGSMGLSCPNNHVLRSVVAYYGQPSGSCACPTYMQVSQKVGNSGSCKSPIVKEEGDYSKCAPVTLESGEEVTYGCFLGTDRFDNKCCAHSQKSYQVEATFTDEVQTIYAADLDGLELNYKPGCNSATAQAIATALCEGKSFCNFDIQGGNVLKLPVQSLPAEFDYNTHCNSLPWYNGERYCALKLEKGNFDSCIENAPLSDFSDEEAWFTWHMQNLYPSYSFSDSTQYFMERRLVVEGICEVDKVVIADQVYTPHDVVQFTSYTNATSILIFILGITWMKIQLKKESMAMTDNTVKASDYTIACWTLPPEAYDESVYTTIPDIKKKLKDFFERILYEESDGAPIDVADVNLVTSCDTYLNHCVERGTAAKEVDGIIAKIQSRIRRKVWDRADPHSQILLTMLKEKMTEFEYANDVCAATTKLAEQSNHMAYITFEEEDAYLKALRKFPYVGQFTRFLQDKDDYFDGQAVIVTPAPEPEELKFENVPIGGFSRLLRVIATTTATLLLLTCSYAMIYQARFVADRFSVGQTNVDCGLYNVDIAPLNPDMPLSPPSLSDITGYVPDSNTVSYFDVLMDEFPDQLQLDATQSTWGQRGIKKCYCSQLMYQAYLDGAEYPSNVMKEYPFEHPITAETVFLCEDPTDTLSLALKILSAGVIVFVNAALVAVLAKMVNFERHATKTGELLSSAIKLFIAQYINTAILTLLIAGDLDKAGIGHWEVRYTLDGYPDFQLGLFSGTINDYNTTWYVSVGSSLFLTMTLFSFSFLPLSVIDVGMQKMRRLWDRRWSFKHGFTMSNTQEELDDSYIGPEMPLQDKYGMLLTLIFCDMTFSPCMPLFNLVTVVNMAVFYFSDKYCLLYFYRKPPNTNAALPKAMINCLYLAALIHMVNGVWMFGNESFSGIEITNDFSTVYDLSYTNNIPETISQLVNRHVYETDIVWMDRAFSSTSLPLMLLALLFGSLIVVGFLRAFLVDILGLKTAVLALGNYLEKNAPAWNFIGLHHLTKLGLPPYFEAIPSHLLKQRYSEHTLDRNIEGKYVHIIQDEEHDKAQMGLSFTVEKARLNRVMKAADKYEHRRRESLMRASLADSSRISLDNLDARHDVAGFIADNIENEHNSRAEENSGLLQALGSIATSGAQLGKNMLEKSVGLDEGEVEYVNHAARRRSMNSQRHHGKELENTLPNRNCPVAFTKPGFKHVRFYEGTYLQYTDPHERIRHALGQARADDKSHHGTHFTFMKHEKGEDDQMDAHEITDVDPRNLCVLARDRAKPFDYSRDCDEDFKEGAVTGLDDCCGHPIGVKYNNQRLSRRFVDKSFMKPEVDIPLFEIGDEVIVYLDRKDVFLQPGVVSSIENQVSAENDPEEQPTELILTGKAKMARKLLELAQSKLKKNAAYETRYKASINSKRAKSSITIKTDDGKETEVPVQWTWLMKPLKYNRTGTFNHHSGIDFLNKISSGNNHEAHGNQATDIDNLSFTYKGKLVFGRPAGYGKFNYSNNDMYMGDFSNGYFHGYGTYVYANHHVNIDLATGLDRTTGEKPSRDYYEGDFFRGKRHGYGVFACNSGDKHRPVYDKAKASVNVALSCREDVNEPENGSLRGNSKEKSHVLLGERPYLYQGEFRDDQIHGFGKKIYIDGSGLIQVGDWINGEPVNGYYKQLDDGTYKKGGKPSLASLGLEEQPGEVGHTKQERDQEYIRVHTNTVTVMSKYLKNRIYQRGELAENTLECGKCVPTFDDTTHDLLRDRCGNTIYICTCCCTCVCSPGGGSIAQTKAVTTAPKVRRHMNRMPGCHLCSKGGDIEYNSIAEAGNKVADKLNGLPRRNKCLKGGCFDEGAYHNMAAGLEMTDVSAGSNGNKVLRYMGEADSTAKDTGDVYDDVSTDEDDSDVEDEAKWGSFDKATGLDLEALRDGTFFTSIGGALSNAPSSVGNAIANAPGTLTDGIEQGINGMTAGASGILGAATKVVTTVEGAVEYGVTESLGLGGIGGPEEAMRAQRSKSSKKSRENAQRRWRAKMSSQHSARAMTMATSDSLEKGEAGAFTDDVGSALVMEGHESYNLNTIGEYQKKFGLETAHMARIAPTDMIMQVANLLKPHESNTIRDILHDCFPYKLKTMVTVTGMKTVLKEGAEKDPLTGKYHAHDYEEVEGEIEEARLTIPSHSLWLSRNLPRCCGGASACNGRVGCECLAEPDDAGNQPKYNNPCC